jgi:predicted nuclease of predicted toxin-antitoxin system
MPRGFRKKKCARRRRNDAISSGHGVSHRVTTWLRGQGHDVVHLRDEGLHRLPNGEIFTKATREQRIVLTFDLDFGEILAQARGAIVSVVLFRLNDASSPFVIRRLERILSDAVESLQEGAIVVVEDSRHRIRRLPLGT